MSSGDTQLQSGITYRQHLVASVVQGIAANASLVGLDIGTVAATAICMVDEVIRRLDNPTTSTTDGEDA